MKVLSIEKREILLKREGVSRHLISSFRNISKKAKRNTSNKRSITGEKSLI